MRINRALIMLGFAVTAGIALIWIEAHNLRLRQKVTELYHKRELLAEDHARLRLEVSRFAAPARVLERVSQSSAPLAEPQLPVTKEPRNTVPLIYIPR